MRLRAWMLRAKRWCRGRGVQLWRGVVRKKRGRAWRLEIGGMGSKVVRFGAFEEVVKFDGNSNN